MALPLMILTAGFARQRQPSVTDARYGYQSSGRHQTLAASLSLIIAGGVGLTLATALVMPEVVTGVIDDTEVIFIPATPPKPTPEPLADPQPSPSASHVTTVPSPLPPMTGEAPTIPYVPFDPGPVGPTIGTVDTGFIVDPVPPHVAVFRSAQRNPRYADQFQPPYPSTMQREGIEGRCPVSVSIAANGRVTAIRDNGCADPAFFRATERQAVQHWRFTPATRDGEPVDSTQDLTVVFRIENAR